MSAITYGSVEILSEAEQVSEGIVVQTAAPERVPEALTIIRGLEGFAAVDPAREGVDREWTARTHDGRDVAVLFREVRLAGPASVT